MFVLAKYGASFTLRFFIVKRAAVDLAATGDWTPATGDTKISKDGGNFANSTNNPSATGGTGSVGWTITLTATEMTAAEINLQIVDSATKAVEDQSITIYTYGHASAKIPFNFDSPTAPGVAEITTTQFGSDATSHAVSMPASVEAGDLLIAFFSNDGNDAVTTPSGWTSKHSTASSTTFRLGTYVKKAAGTEGGTTVDFVTAGAQKAVAQVYRIKRGHWYGDITQVEVGTAATGTSTAPDPPTLAASWKGVDTLFIAVMGSQDGTKTTSAYPANYVDGATQVSDSNATGCNIASAVRTGPGASENPGAFTTSSSDDWVAQTVAIRGSLRLAPGELPANFGLTSIDANGRVDVIKVAGTTQTARDIGASVLLSPGTGTGQLDITSGVAKANLAQILGTALTETSGQIAAAFKKFFDKSSPTGTINSIPDAVAGATGGIAIVGSAMTLASSAVQAIWDALTSALTTVGSIGKLLVDNINATISSRLASASYTAPLDAAGTRSAVGLASANLDTQFSGILSKLLKYVQLMLRKDSAIATDNSTELTAINADGGSGSGAYANTTDSQEATRDNMGTAQTGDAYARLGAPAGASVSADIAAAKTVVDGIKTKTDSLTFTVSGQVDANVTNWKGSTAPAMTGDAFARLGAPAGASVSADVAAVKSDSAAIKAKTDNLPSSPAAVGSPMTLADDAITAAKFDESTAFPVKSDDSGATQIARKGADSDTLKSLSDQLDGIHSKTTNLPASPAATGDIPTPGDISDEIGAAVVEGSITRDDVLRLELAAQGAKTDGGGTTTFHVRDTADSKNRVTATVDANGNRSAVTLDLSE